MNATFVRIAAVAFAVVAAGCGRIAIYKDAELKQETGIPFYEVKPYLLISNTGAKDKPVEVSVQYLPDPTKKLYAKLKSGIGTADLKMNFQNGILTSVGQMTDPQFDELLTAIGSLGTAGAGAFKTVKEAAALAAQAGEVDQKALAQSLENIATSLKEVHADQPLLRGLTPTQVNLLSILALNFEEYAKTLKPGTASPADLVNILARLKEAADTWDKTLVIPEPAASPELAIVKNKLTAARAELGSVIAALTPDEVPAPKVLLYEIVPNETGTIMLRLVPTAP